MGKREKTTLQFKSIFKKRRWGVGFFCFGGGGGGGGSVYQERIITLFYKNYAKSSYQSFFHPNYGSESL